MCGIVAYLGDKEAQPLLLEGLRRLEYRGYDSSGIAILNGHGLEIVKKVGRIQNLEERARRSSAARFARYLPHPLGHPRQGERHQRPSPYRRLRQTGHRP